uniref:Ovule protein n=1 Tax=Bursaphelenchus xylophilus TaxID=6326 RepID=A0A1I7RY60_BURXY
MSLHGFRPNRSLESLFLHEDGLKSGQGNIQNSSNSQSYFLMTIDNMSLELDQSSECDFHAVFGLFLL